MAPGGLHQIAGGQQESKNEQAGDRQPDQTELNHSSRYVERPKQRQDESGPVRIGPETALNDAQMSREKLSTELGGYSPTTGCSAISGGTSGRSRWPGLSRPSPRSRSPRSRSRSLRPGLAPTFSVMSSPVA
jgi:hypothetical protein